VGDERIGRQATDGDIPKSPMSGDFEEGIGGGGEYVWGLENSEFVDFPV